MEAWIQEWLSLLLRWAHFITGVAWIGASFYFNWLENHLERQNARDGIAGDLWAVHGGGFYHLEKYAVAPARLPPTLHWFKYEAYFTWITGFALLCTVYYWNAGALLVDRSVADLAGWQATGIGLGSMVLSWLFYDLACRSPLARHNSVLALTVLAWFVALAWFLSESLSGRAAYIHVGAAIGTIMVANVFFVIIPAQKDLVAAVSEDRAPRADKGENALLRSRHNNYLRHLRPSLELAAARTAGRGRRRHSPLVQHPAPGRTQSLGAAPVPAAARRPLPDHEAPGGSGAGR
jgi:uncharacterized membrane protein